MADGMKSDHILRKLDVYKRQGTGTLNITNNALSLENLKALAAVAGKTTTVNSKSVTVMTDDKNAAGGCLLYTSRCV